MELLFRAAGSVGSFVAETLRSFTELFLAQPLGASPVLLEEADLKTLDGGRDFCLVRFCEASELSSLCPQLDELGVPLYAVVKEDVGTEVQNFRPYFNGEVYLDEKRCFYGPRERKMGLTGFLRVGVWKSGLRAFNNGFLGNVFGEGFILGAVYVIGPGQEGILFEHREMEFGDKVNVQDVLHAARRINSQLQLAS
uniref:Peroxiredoxin-like 2A n=1 Tax=Denticeps clupeoides TaxID=299321 RepID=A0AAY4AIT0_9TELE